MHPAGRISGVLCVPFVGRPVTLRKRCAKLIPVRSLVLLNYPQTTERLSVMKKKLSLLCVLGCFAQPVWAANINSLGALDQSEFKLFSEDLGAALSYKAVIPAEPLGVTGFDLGLEVTSTEMKNSTLWTSATGGGTPLSSLIVPKLHVHKG